MNRYTLAAAAACAIFALATVAPSVGAQPKGPHPRAKARAERRQERRKDRAEHRQERREDRAERRQERREDRAERRKQWREKHAEKRARYKELKDKEAKGELTAEEKEELDKMHKRHEVIKARYQAIKVRHAKLRKTLRRRRRAARRALLERWGRRIGKHPALRAELKVHARRMARLHRLREIYEAQERPDAVKKVNDVIERERARHDKRMAALAAKKEAK